MYMWDKIDKLATLFEKIAKAQPVYLYHGTSVDVLPHIMSQGLIPNPKKRAWEDDSGASFYMSSRQSLKSVYLTSNLLTALGSATRGSQRQNQKPGNAILVVVSMQPQSLVADEDSLMQLAHPCASGWSEFLVAGLYVSALIKPDKNVQEAKDDYIENNLKSLSRLLTQQPNPKLLQRVKELLDKGFVVALARKAAYADEWDWKRAIDNFGEGKEVPKPSVTEVEQQFKQYQDQMTRTLKIMARPAEVEDLFNFTARYNDTIGFTKSNRIVAIFAQKRLENYNSYLKLLYPNALDKVPSEAVDKLRADWKQSMGPELIIR